MLSSDEGYPRPFNDAHHHCSVSSTPPGYALPAVLSDSSGRIGVAAGANRSKSRVNATRTIEGVGPEKPPSEFSKSIMLNQLGISWP
jgi:hypothetical protein